MKFGFCHLSIVPCRREPNDRAEMVTQLLFGDVFEILEIHPKWIRIKDAYDGYEAWIDHKQWLEIPIETFEELKNTHSHKVVSDLAAVVRINSKEVQSILIGSSLPGLDENQVVKVESQSFAFDGSFFDLTSQPQKAKLVENSFMYLNAPYLWGGKTPFGIDCSGFTQMVYKLNGFALPRDAYQQAEIGETLSFVEEAEPGDLAFFDDDEGNIIHVGMVLEQGTIIHASGRVRVDALDHQGIYNKELKNYSHKLRLIKKIID